MVEENANVDECWIHGEDPLKCNILFKKSKLSLSTLLTQRFCIDLVNLRTFTYFGICKERMAFVLVSWQVGMYFMRGLMSDSQVRMVPPNARILAVYQVLQGRRYYPHNINIKCNLLFSEHIKRVK